MNDSILDCTLGDALEKYGPEKIASETLPFLLDKIRETSVLCRVLPPQFVKKDNIERDIYHNNPLIRVDIGPSKGEVSLWYNRGGEAIFSKPGWPRYECHLNEYPPEKSIKLHGQMMGLTVRQVIETNCVRAIQKAMDKDFCRTLYTATIKSDSIIKPEMGNKPTKLIDLISKARKKMVNGTGGSLCPMRIITPCHCSLPIGQTRSQCRHAHQFTRWR